MPNKYMEKYKKLVDLAWLATEGYNRGENKDKYYKEAMMYATVANAMTSMFSINILEDTAEEKPKETKPATKEDLKPKPVMHTVGSEDSSETGIVPEVKKEESKAEMKETENKPMETMPASNESVEKIFGVSFEPSENMTQAEAINVINEIINTLKDPSKHKNGFSIPMVMIMAWASEAVGEKINDLNELNNHMDKLPQLYYYFIRLHFIFNQLQAGFEDVTSALNTATNGRYKAIEQLYPENIDNVITVFGEWYKQFQNQQQAAAQ